MKVTARDVAREAGVSPATASLVFRGKPGVGPETRARVLEVARQMGFEYGATEASKRTSTILLVIYKRHGQVVADTQFFEELTKGISDATYRHGYHRLSISYFYASEDSAEQLRSLKSVKCAGIILLATELLAQDIAQFERLDVPIVLLDNWFPTKKLDSVVIDNTRGAWMAVRHLRNAGHTEIGYLHCGVSIRNFLERQEGFLSATRDLDQSAHRAPAIIRVSSTMEGAHEDMASYLDTNPRLCSAYFADNDLIAAGAIAALQEHGIRVPEDVSVVGFDDTPVCEMTTPRLTSMSVNKAAMGDLAVTRLINLINGETNDEVVRVCCGTKIVERDSVRRIRR